MVSYLNLFWTFFKIGLFTFGGGAAMLPLLRMEVVEKNKWATDEELLDYYSISAFFSLSPSLYHSRNCS